MKDKISVLLYSALPRKIQGGIAVWTRSFLDQADRNGISCTLINNAAIGKRADNPEAKISIFDEIKRTKGIVCSLKKSLREVKIDVAHINTSCGPMGIIRDYIVVKTLRRRRVKIITHFHCDIPFWVNNRISKFFLKKLVSNSDQVLVLCANSSNYLKKELNRESVFLPNFISKDYIAEGKIIHDECKKVIYVGGIQPEKGCYEFFQVARLFPEMSFTMVGQKSPEVEKEQAPSNVYFTGVLNRESVLETIDNCDVFLFPSHSEGFSISLLEAMSRGLPIITTDVGANAQMIEADGGIIVPVGDIPSIVKALQMIRDPELRKRMSQWNINKVLANYIEERVFSALRAIYESVKKGDSYDFV